MTNRKLWTIFKSPWPLQCQVNYGWDWFEVLEDLHLISTKISFLPKVLRIMQHEQNPYAFMLQTLWITTSALPTLKTQYEEQVCWASFCTNNRKTVSPIVCCNQNTKANCTILFMEYLVAMKAMKWNLWNRLWQKIIFVQFS